MAKKKKNKNPYRDTRSYLQIVYPDSAPLNWIQLIQAEIDRGYIRYAIISPLHDMDRYTTADETEASRLRARIPATTEAISADTARLIQELGFGANVREGELKKPHYHVIYELKNSRRNREANAYFKSLTNGANVIARDDLRGAVRYLPHLDEDPNQKVWYDPSEIIVLGDIKIDRYLMDEDASMSTLIAWYAIEDLLDEHNVTNMTQFDKLMRSQDIDLQQKAMTNQNLRNRIRDNVKDRSKYNEQKKNEDIEDGILSILDIREANIRKQREELEKDKKKWEEIKANPFFGAYRG